MTNTQAELLAAIRASAAPVLVRTARRVVGSGRGYTFDGAREPTLAALVSTGLVALSEEESREGAITTARTYAVALPAGAR